MQQYKAISIRVKDKETDVVHSVEHDHRLYVEAKNMPKYIDASKTYMNQILFQHPEYPVPQRKNREKIKEYIQKIEERNKTDFQRLKSEGKIARNQGYQIKRPVMSGILTLSHEAKQELKDPRKMEEFLVYAKNYLLKLADALGTDLLYAVLHVDETSPHIHFAMRNIRVRTGQWTDEKALGKSLSSTFYSLSSVRAKNGKPYQIEYTKLQDSLNFFNKIGFGRGVPRAEREKRGEPMHTYIHRSVRQLHEDLPKEIQSLNKEITDKKEVLQSLNKEITDKKEVLQSLNKKITNKKQELAETDKQFWEKYNEILVASAKLKEIKKELAIIEEQMKLTKQQKEKNRQEALMRIQKRLAQEENTTEQKRKEKDRDTYTDIQTNTNNSFNIEP